MKKTFYIFLFTWLHVFAVEAKIAPSPSQDEMTLKKELSSIQKDIQKLEKNVSSGHKQEALLNHELATLEKAIGEYSEQLRVLENKKGLQQKTILSLKAQHTELEKKHQHQVSHLSQLIRESYYSQRKEKLQLLFTPMAWANRLRQDVYYQFFSLAKAGEIRQLMDELNKITSLEEKIAQEQITLDQTSEQVVSKKEKLHHTLQQRKNLLLTLNADLKSFNKQMAYLQQQEHQLEKLFKKLQGRLNTTLTHIDPAQDFAKMKHQLPLPILENNVTFSALPNLTPSSSKKTYITAPNGTPVSAIFPGRVVFAEWLRGVGLLIILDHGNGYLSLYGNNQKLYKGLGEWVNAGEMIARVGQSGGHTEPGLYFEIRKDGQTLDPTSWFSNLG